MAKSLVLPPHLRRYRRVEAAKQGLIGLLFICLLRNKILEPIQHNIYNTLFLHNGQQVNLMLTTPCARARTSIRRPSTRPFRCYCPYDNKTPTPASIHHGEIHDLVCAHCLQHANKSVPRFTAHNLTLYGYRSLRKYGSPQRTVQQTSTHPTRHRPREDTFLPEYVHRQGAQPTLSLQGDNYTPTYLHTRNSWAQASPFTSQQNHTEGAPRTTRIGATN